MNRDLDKLFEAAKKDSSAVSFEKVSERLVNSIQSNAPRQSLKDSQWFNLKKLMIMTTIVVTIAIGIGLFSTSEIKSDKKEIVASEPEKEMVMPSVSDTKDLIPEVLPFKGIKPVDKDLPESELVVLGPYVMKQKDYLQQKGAQEKSLPTFEEGYPFPRLTQDEINANNKQKKNMLKALEKLDKKALAFVPSGSFEYQGAQISVQAFYMSKTEVTNLEYRTFLFDLLIQGKKEEFLKAKPDQAKWTELFGESNKAMEELYFSEEAYNDYPVVNVSREGAEMYCFWITDELNKTLIGKGKKPFNDLRLPLHVEWVKAASDEGRNLPYPWNGEFLRNAEGCYLANLKPTNGAYSDDGGFHTVKVNSYNPNALGIFNLSGNVAEMVYDTEKRKDLPKTVGGGWMSNEEELKILGPDPYSGKTEAHPNIGFRVVFTYMNQ